MRAIIAGKRDFTDKQFAFKTLDAIFKKTGMPDEIIEGGAKGADALGHAYAKERGIATKRFPAAWSLHGKAAGPIRNRQMAEYAHKSQDGKAMLIAFWDGSSRGTANMIKTAEGMGIDVNVVNIGDTENG